MIEDLLMVLLAFASFGGAFFFAGLEIGYYRLSQIKLSQRVKSGELVAQWWLFMVRHREWFLVTVFVGVNLSSDIFSGVLYNAVESVATRTRVSEWIDSVWLSTLICTPLTLIGAEIVPKRLFNRVADSLMYRLFIVVPAFLAMFVLAPLIVGLVVISWLIGKLLRLSTSQREGSLSHESLRYLIEVEAHRVSAPMRAFALQLLDSHQRQIESVMLSWDGAAVLAEDAPLRNCLDAFHSADAFRLLVHAKDNPRKVLGSISLFDVAAEDRLDKPVASIMRSACLIPASAKVKDAIKMLQVHKQSVAAVVNERNEAVGMVSLELLSAELVASIKETGATVG